MVDSFEKRTESRSSDPEKILDSKDPLAAAGFEDPDAGLSDEEKAEIVCYHPMRSTSFEVTVTNHSTNTIGPQATMETRYPSRAMAESTLSRFVP